MASVFHVQELTKTILEHLVVFTYRHGNQLVTLSDSRKDLYHASLVSRAFRGPASELLWKHLPSFRAFAKILDGGPHQKPEWRPIENISARVQTLCIMSEKRDKTENEIYLQLYALAGSQSIFPNLRKCTWYYEDYATPTHLLGMAAPTLTVLRVTTGSPTRHGIRRADSAGYMMDGVLERCLLLEDIRLQDRIQDESISLGPVQGLRALRRVELNPGPSDVDDPIIQHLMMLPNMNWISVCAPRWEPRENHWNMEITGGGTSITVARMVKIEGELLKLPSLIKRLPGVKSASALHLKLNNSIYIPASAWKDRWAQLGQIIKSKFGNSIQGIELDDDGPRNACLSALVDALKGFSNVTKFVYCRNGVWSHAREGVTITLDDLERMGALWPSLTHVDLGGCNISTIHQPGSRMPSGDPLPYGLGVLPLLARPFPMLRILKTTVTDMLDPPTHREHNHDIMACNLEELTLYNNRFHQDDTNHLSACWGALYYLTSSFSSLRKISVHNQDLDSRNCRHRGLDFARKLRFDSTLLERALPPGDLESGMLIVVENSGGEKDWFLTIDEVQVLELVHEAPGPRMQLTRSIRSGKCVWVASDHIKGLVDDTQTILYATEWNEAWVESRRMIVLAEWASLIELTLFATPSKKHPPALDLTQIDHIFLKLEQAEFTWRDLLDWPRPRICDVVDQLCNAKLPSIMLTKQYKWKVRARRLQERWSR